MHTKWFYPIVTAAFGAALVLLGNWPAAAADLQPVFNVKAPRTPFMGCSWYGGLGTHAENTNVGVSGQSNNLLGGGLGGTFEVGAALDVTGGYMCASATRMRFVEVTGSYKNIGGGNIAAIDPLTGVAGTASVGSKWGFTERVGIGGAWSEVLALIPNLSTIMGAAPLPSLPSGAVDAHLYMFVALHQDRVNATFDVASASVWQNRFGFGPGTKFRPSPTSNVVMDVWAEYIPAGTGFNVNAPNQNVFAQANNGREWRIGTSASVGF